MIDPAGSWTGRVSEHVPERAARIAVSLAAWSFVYACYRGYYAAGGEAGRIGVPVSPSQLRAINAVGVGVIIVFGTALPLVLVRVRPLWRLVPVLGWIGAVGCCMHATVDIILRIFSVTGLHPTELPADVWKSFDRQAADWQDLLLNEPWFLVAGVLWAALALTFVQPARRHRWLVSALSAIAVLTVVGVLSGLDVIGSSRVG